MRSIEHTSISRYSSLTSIYIVSLPGQMLGARWTYQIALINHFINNGEDIGTWLNSHRELIAGWKVHSETNPGHAQT